jgi:hypothetical protein
MTALFDFFGTLIKRIFIALFLIGGLLLGLLIAIKVLIIFAVLRLIRAFRAPRAKPAVGNVFDGEYSVVKPRTAPRATVLMVEPRKTTSGVP